MARTSVSNVNVTKIVILFVALALFAGMREARASAGVDFSTFLGGSGNDFIRAIDKDSQGNLYVAGGTGSAGFPRTFGAFHPAFNGSRPNVVVAKFDSAGRFLWSRVFGGNNEGDSYAYTCNVTRDGQHVYVTGRAAPGLPTTPGVVQPAFNGVLQDGSHGKQNAFVAKVSSDGTRLEFLTYLGVATLARGADDCPDGSIAVVCGALSGRTPPLAWYANGYQPAPRGGMDYGLVNLSADGKQILHGTFFGGSADEPAGANTVKVHDDGTVYGFFSTRSTDIPTTTGAWDRTLGGVQDGYVARFSADLRSLLFGTYVGGSGTEFTSIHHGEVDAQGNAYAGFETASTDFATTPGAFQPAFGGSGGNGPEIALVKLSSSGGRLAASYLGGLGNETIEGIALDAAGRIYISGQTSSTNFPVTPDAFQSANKGGNLSPNGGNEGFLVVVENDLSQILYGTYYGGSKMDELRCIALLPGGGCVCGGTSQSPDFHTKNAHDGSYNGQTDAVLVKFTTNFGAANLPPRIDSPPTALPASFPAPGTTALHVAASDPDGGPQALTYTWTTLSGPAQATFTPNATTASDFTTAALTVAGVYVFRVTVSDGAASVTDVVTVTATGGSVPITARFYASSGDGTVIHDGAANAPWSAVHDAAAGTAADWTSAGRDLNVSNYSTAGGPRIEIRRGFFVFDTSAIPDTATIRSAALKAYVSGKANGDSDGDDFYVLVPATPASAASLTPDDFDRAGAATNPQEFSGRLDLGNLPAAAYAAWSLNAAGLSHIAKTGVTTLGLREGHDVLNRPIAAGKTNKIAVKFSEEAGSSKDPYLEVTYDP